MSKKKSDRHVLKWWMVPKRDEQGQWWWGYQKVRLNVLPESEKQKFINSFNLDRYKDTNHGH